LLEGLEVRETNLSITLNNKDFRIDSDFWTKEPLKNPRLNYNKIGNLIKSAQYGISISMNEDGIGYPIYRMNEIHNMMCDLSVDKHANISSDEFQKFKLNDRDVLFNRTNSYELVGRTGIYRQVDKQPFTFASYLVRFITDEDFINPEYLTTYLNTKYGIWDIKRRSRQSINQTNVNPEEVKEIFIPKLNREIQRKIKDCFDRAHNNRIKSNDLYMAAETLLLETIGLKNFQTSPDPINIKYFKDSFGIKGRLDAEYYQKKYDDIEMALKKSTKCLPFGEVILKIDTGEYSPKYYLKNEFPDLAFYIRSTNIKGGQIELDDDYYVRKRDFTRFVEEGDVVTARVGSVGVFGEVRKELVGSIYSDNILCFRLPSNYISSVYVLLFNSNIYFELIDRLARGSVQQRLNQETLKEAIIPLIDYKKQKQIAALVEESFSLKKQSEKLLENTKRAVEIAIEQNEENALKYLKENNI
jgi:restriction endonuclease S subunit